MDIITGIKKAISTQFKYFHIYSMYTVQTTNHTYLYMLFPQLITLIGESTFRDEEPLYIFK